MIMKIIEKDWRDPFLRYIYVKILYDLPVKKQGVTEIHFVKKVPTRPPFFFQELKTRQYLLYTREVS